MEPLAPGTEDEMVDFGLLNKQETENERLLKLKTVLKNGSYDNIFELTFVNGCEHWFCKVCECPIMGRVYQHELGRRHTQNMSMKHSQEIKEAGVQGDVVADDNSNRMEIAPGEPVPPGFEGEMNRRAQIQERLDGFKVGPLVALEYLIEMQDYDPTKEAMYLCILCDKKGDPRTVLTHLASYNHISQYLQKHFPTCYRALAPYMTKQHKRNWQGVLQKIAEAIEQKFGRLRPFCIDQDKFEKDRMYYLSMISKGKHFSEQIGPTFVELVVHEELTKTFDEEGRPLKPQTASFGSNAFIEREPVKQKVLKRSPSPPIVARPIKRTRAPLPSDESKKPADEGKPTGRAMAGGPRGRRRSLSSVSSMSSEEGQAKGGRRFARNRSPPRDSGRRPLDHRDNRRGFNNRRSPSPKRKSARDDEEERRRNREKERLQKLEEFTKLSKAIENDIDKTIKQYEKNPEKHPKYNDEWKLFWNKRYKEIQAEGNDASKHDFKPEWIEFWGKRMRELSDEELKKRKDGLRRRLGLPEEALPVSFRIGGGPPPSNPPPPKRAQPKETRPTMPMAARPDNDPEVILLDDKDDDVPQPKKTIVRNRERSHSPWESDTSPPRAMPKGRRPSRSPGPDKRRGGGGGGGKPNIRSRERSFERKRSLERRRSPERGRRSPDRGRSDRNDRQRRSRSRDVREQPMRRSRSREQPMRRSRSREQPMRRSKETSLRRSPGMSRDRRSRSPDSYKGGKSFPRDRERSERDYFRDREMRDRDMDMNPGGFSSMERSWERGIRESSFERDVRGRDRIRTVADLPWEREKMMYSHGPHLHGPPHIMMPHDDFYAPPPMMRDISRMPLNFVPPDNDPEPDDGEVNIVSILRLLTALEEKLGSLGPKVIDLLAQALALEKKEANSSETLLDNEINCVLFETVKEKLKGQLLAGLVDPIQERAFKKAIHKTANLIHLASQRKRERTLPVPAAVAVPGVGAVDKAAIARQLANALVAQGKTDVTQAELEQLINAVVGMAEASKGSNKPMTTAGLLSQLTGGAGKSTSEPVKDKIIIPRVRQSEEKRDRPRDKDPLADLETEPLSPSTPERSSTSNMENLSDSDLQTLLQNFKDLSTEEQMNLINYLKKMELDEPDRVERLRKFVNLGADKSSREVIDLDRETSPSRNGKRSPFSNRREEANPESDTFNKRRKDDKNVKIHLDSEDEDYSYEDVVKAASKNIKQKEMEDNRKIVEDSIVFSSAQKETNLADAKTLISNLMSSLAGTAVSSTVNLLGLPISSSTTSASSNNVTTPTSSADFARTLSGINMDNLASIVSNVQKASKDKQQINFEPPAENSLSPRERISSVETRLPNPLATEKTAPHIISVTQIRGPTVTFDPAQTTQGPISTGPRGPMQPFHAGPGRMGPARPMGPGTAGLMGHGPPGHMGPGPSGLLGMGPGSFPQRGPNPNQFGNSHFMNQRPSRPQFNPRFGGPRGPGFNNRW